MGRQGVRDLGSPGRTVDVHRAARSRRSFRGRFGEAWPETGRSSRYMGAERRRVDNRFRGRHEGGPSRRLDKPHLPIRRDHLLLAKGRGKGSHIPGQL